MHIGKRWSPEQAKIIGRIILSNFLELSLDKFEKYIQAVEKSPLFTKLMSDGVLTVRHIPNGNPASIKGVKPDNIIAKVLKNRGRLCVRFYHAGFTRKYIVDGRKLLALNNSSSDQENYEIHLLLCNLRNG